MQKFKCTKEVYANPMTRQEYNDYRGWVLDSDEDGSDEGYLVEYVDGGKPNHLDHKGYISWSPKDVFEKGYSNVTSQKDRLDLEFKELWSKSLMLKKVLVIDLDRDEIDKTKKNLLRAQLGAMSSYLEMLDIRIQLEGEK